MLVVVGEPHRFFGGVEDLGQVARAVVAEGDQRGARLGVSDAQQAQRGDAQQLRVRVDRDAVAAGMCHLQRGAVRVIGEGDGPAVAVLDHLEGEFVAVCGRGREVEGAGLLGDLDPHRAARRAVPAQWPARAPHWVGVLLGLRYRVAQHHALGRYEHDPFRVQLQSLVEGGGPGAAEPSSAGVTGDEGTLQDQRQRPRQGHVRGRHEHLAGRHVNRVGFAVLLDPALVRALVVRPVGRLAVPAQLLLTQRQPLGRGLADVPQLLAQHARTARGHGEQQRRGDLAGRADRVLGPHVPVGGRLHELLRVRRRVRRAVQHAGQQHREPCAVAFDERGGEFGHVEDHVMGLPQPVLEAVPGLLPVARLVRGLLRRLVDLLFRRVDDQVQLGDQLVQPTDAVLHRGDARIGLRGLLRQLRIAARHRVVVGLDLLEVRLGRRPRSVRVLDDRLAALLYGAQLGGVRRQRTRHVRELVVARGQFLRQPVDGLPELTRAPALPVLQVRQPQLVLAVLEGARIRA